MKLTSHLQHSKRGKDGKRRSYELFFLDGIEILKQKAPFETDYDHGFQHHTHISEVFLLNGILHQTRTKFGKVRKVKFPVSKKKLLQFDIPKDLKILMN